MEKKQYIANTGLDFDGMKGKPRVEAGELIPDIPDSEITQLLKDGHIKEVKPEKVTSKDVE